MKSTQNNMKSTQKKMISAPKEHSSAIYKRVINVYQIASVIFQVDILKENYKVNIMIYVDFFLMFHYLASTIYTIVTQWEDLPIVLRAMCLEGLNIQLFVKALTVVFFAKQMYALSKEALDIHNEEKGPYQEIMYDSAQRLMLMTKVQFSLYFFNAIAFCCYPLYCYIALNEKLLIYDLLLPFDPSTRNGYAISIAIQIFLTYGTTVCIFAVDLLFLLTVSNGAVHFSLFECDCNMLTIALERKDRKLYLLKRNDESKDDIHELLIKCIQRSQFIYKYFAQVNKIFEKYCLIQVYCSALTILLCVFVAKTSDWFVVYLIAVSGIYQLTIYCIVGSYVEYKSEEIVKAVYHVSWYKLTVHEQLMWKLLLQYVQNTIRITVMGERKLNIQTGCAVYKTIYSAFVMLEQFY